MSLILSLVARLPIIATDVIVLVITWTRTFQLVREAMKTGLDASLSATLLRDGVYHTKPSSSRPYTEPAIQEAFTSCTTLIFFPHSDLIFETCFRIFFILNVLDILLTLVVSSHCCRSTFRRSVNSSASRP